MSTQTTHTINQINHRVRSGGIYWKQFNIGKGHCGANRQGVWYFASEARLADVGQPKWLITNSNLASLLYVSSSNLAKYVVLANDKQAVYHDDAPTHFIVDEGKPIKRTRQLLWTIEGVNFILDKSGIRIGGVIKADIRTWIAAQSAVYGDNYRAVSLIDKPIAAPKVKPKENNITSVVDARQNIIDAVHYITNIIDQLWLERNKRRELEDEVANLRSQIDRVSNAPVDSCVLKESKQIQIHKVNGSRFDFAKESLSQYVSRNGKKHHRAEQLTRMGLLNSDQIYSLFSDSWIDSSTGKLINKDKFQEVLRKVFHLKHSTHRTPMLKSEMIRDDMAIVCQVFCKKKPNPVADNGDVLEVDNPAYLSSPEPCVRFQTRYTSKGIDYLKNNWYMLVESSSGQEIKA
jgi:hypothetical protein